jgi:hypothetical protein
MRIGRLVEEADVVFGSKAALTGPKRRFRFARSTDIDRPALLVRFVPTSDVARCDKVNYLRHEGPPISGRRIDAGVWIGMKDTDIEQLLARLRELHKKCHPDEPWRIEKEPHNYPDGTTHFNHVRQTAHINGEPLAVTIASHVTPDLAELALRLPVRR